MKNSFYLAFLLSLFISCTHNENKSSPGSKFKMEVMEIAIDYTMGKFKEAKKTVEKDGTVTIADSQINYVTKGDNQLRYVVDPVKIVVGLIDDDANEDAIITISSFTGQYLEIPEHLILIKADGKLMLSRVIESYMKIMSIKERVITVEIPTRSPNSPLRDCSVCKEIVKYQFRVGDLIRIE